MEVVTINFSSQQKKNICISDEIKTILINMADNYYKISTNKVKAHQHNITTHLI